MPQPLITAQPISQVSALGVTARFSVSVSGIPPSYQWRKDGTDIGGATGSVYSIANVRANDAGSYSVIITNVSGSVTGSDAVLTVVPIVITQQPQNRPAPWAGTTARFGVTAPGSAPLSYQWRKDGTNISGATSPVFNISNVQSNDEGSYSVIITNAYGFVTSSNAVLTVVPNPSLSFRSLAHDEHEPFVRIGLKLGAGHFPAIVQLQQPGKGIFRNHVEPKVSASSHGKQRRTLRPT